MSEKELPSIFHVIDRKTEAAGICVSDKMLAFVGLCDGRSYTRMVLQPYELVAAKVCKLVEPVTEPLDETRRRKSREFFTDTTLSSLAFFVFPDGLSSCIYATQFLKHVQGCDPGADITRIVRDYRAATNARLIGYDPTQIELASDETVKVFPMKRDSKTLVGAAEWLREHDGVRASRYFGTSPHPLANVLALRGSDSREGILAYYMSEFADGGYVVNETTSEPVIALLNAIAATGMIQNFEAEEAERLRQEAFSRQVEARLAEARRETEERERKEAAELEAWMASPEYKAQQEAEEAERLRKEQEAEAARERIRAQRAAEAARLQEMLDRHEAYKKPEAIRAQLIELQRRQNDKGFRIRMFHGATVDCGYTMAFDAIRRGNAQLA